MKTPTTTTSSNVLWIWTIAFLLLGVGLFALQSLMGRGYYFGELGAFALMTGCAIGLYKGERDTVRPVFDPLA